MNKIKHSQPRYPNSWNPNNLYNIFYFIFICFYFLGVGFFLISEAPLTVMPMTFSSIVELGTECSDL